jgi:hypothetical protein
MTPTQQSETPPEPVKPQTFSIEFPEYLRSKFQDAARASGMSVVDWALVVLESASGQVPEGGQN